MPSYSLHDWNQKGKKFRWNDHEIFFIDADNDNPPLLLIHGFPTASFDWRKVWDKLCENFRPIAIDMIGFGFSDKPKSFDYTIKNQASLIIDLTKRLNINAFHILAHDYGDSVAQEIIRHHNTFTYQDIDQYKVLSACLLNGGIFPEVTNHLTIQKLLVGSLGFIFSKFLNEQRFNRSFTKVFTQDTLPSDVELKEYWQLVSRKNGHRIAHKIIQYLKEREEFDEDWRKGLKKFTGPIALINGIEDPISGSGMVEAYKLAISTKNIFIMKNIGHYPQLEDPIEFSRLFNGFHQTIALRS